jgi:hypothetical protein
MRVLMAFAIVGLFLSGCKSREEALPTATSAASVQKSDHLAPGELLPGTEKAFALVLPREAKVTYRFPTAVHVVAAVPLEPIANYIRARVRDGNVQVGASETRFERVRVPEDASRILRIRVATQNGTSRIIVEDVTPPPEPTGTPAEIMQKAGLTPDGKIANPTKFE